MNRIPRLAAAASMVLALAACSDSTTTQPEMEEVGPPQVGVADRAAIPEYPEALDLKVSCYTGPDGDFSEECPVLSWGSYTYWALSHGDNRFGMTILAFDEGGELVESWERTGARYLWQITVDEEAETVTFSGQDGFIIEMTWEELTL